MQTEIRPKKQLVSINLSNQTRGYVAKLRASTNADSDSEVIRNCIRLAYSILMASDQGSNITITNPDGTLIDITMSEFTDSGFS